MLPSSVEVLEYAAMKRQDVADHCSQDLHTASDGEVATLHGEAAEAAHNASGDENDAGGSDTMVLMSNRKRRSLRSADGFDVGRTATQPLEMPLQQGSDADAAPGACHKNTGAGLSAESSAKDAPQLGGQASSAQGGALTGDFTAAGGLINALVSWT